MNETVGLISIIVMLLTALYRIAKWQGRDDARVDAERAYMRGMEELAKWSKEQERGK